jgi:sulfite exporter TauE/SafE
VSILIAIDGVANPVAIAAGALMIAAGLLLTGAVKSERLIQIGASSTIAKVGGRLLRSRARFVTGLVLGLLPCGLIYAALLKSIASASPVAGALSMLAFGLGTAGPLLGLGAFSAVITRRFRSQKLAAVGVTLMGAFLVWRGLMPVTAASHLHHH